MSVTMRGVAATSDLRGRTGAVRMPSAAGDVSVAARSATDVLALSGAVRPAAYAGVAASVAPQPTPDGGMLGRLRQGFTQASAGARSLLSQVWQRFQQVFLGGRRNMPADLEQRLATQSVQRAIAEVGARNGNSGLVRDPAVQGRVQGILDRLGAAAGNGRAYKAVVLDDAQPNAYSMGGGHIAITKGMLAKLQSNDELAFVLGHEITHDRNRDVMGGVALDQEKGRLASLLSRIPGGRQVVGMFQKMTEALTRAVEHQADAGGLDLARKAGFDGGASVRMNERFLQELKAGGGRDVATTHPPFAERIQRLWQRLRGA